MSHLTTTHIYSPATFAELPVGHQFICHFDTSYIITYTRQELHTVDILINMIKVDQYFLNFFLNLVVQIIDKKYKFETPGCLQVDITLKAPLYSFFIEYIIYKTVVSLETIYPMSTFKIWKTPNRKYSNQIIFLNTPDGLSNYY
jgi:hypothetical protein